MPVTELYASSDIKTKKQTFKNRKLCRKDLKDEGKVILSEKYIHASLVHKAPGKRGGCNGSTQHLGQSRLALKTKTESLAAVR